MDTYLVTGGAGFIGSHLAEALLHRGHHVRILDNFSSGRAANLAAIRDDVEVVEGDVRDSGTVGRAMAGVAIVLHQAALPSVQRSVENPATTNAVNVDGTLNVLIAARDAEVRRVVVASSSSVYGDTPLLPKVETMAPDPRSPYAVSKLATERYALAWTCTFGLPTIALRYFNVFGPRQDPLSHYAAVIPRFITRILDDQPPIIFGDGLQSRDFTYVDDVVAANLLAATAAPETTGIFNVAAGGRHTLLDLVATLNHLLGVSIVPEHAPARVGEVRHSQAAIGAIRQSLGFLPRFTFAEGVAKTVDAFREQPLEKMVNA